MSWFSAVAVHLGGLPCGVAGAFGVLALTTRPRAGCIPAACRASVVPRQVEDSIAALHSTNAVLGAVALPCNTYQCTAALQKWLVWTYAQILPLALLLLLGLLIAPGCTSASFTLDI